MYSANLTSLLARPGREKAINNLYQLEEAMELQGYNLYVERHSSSFSLLENGTGIYQRLWKMMTTRQPEYLLESVEEGVELVRDTTKTAVIAGRETLYFDIQRFGPNYFHLSKKLNTAYSAIAFQMGCPYAEEINRILIAMFEAGITTKLTEDEYENLGRTKESQRAAAADSAVQTNVKKERAQEKSNEKLQPINIKMLQGAFFLLIIGNLLSAITIMAEIFFCKHKRQIRRIKKGQIEYLNKSFNVAVQFLVDQKDLIKWHYRRILNDAYIDTLDYLE